MVPLGPITRDLLTSRGGSSGEPPPAGCGTYPPARRRRATSRLSFCARPNRRSSARTPHSSLRPTSYGASSSAWRRAGSPRPGWPQPPSAARRSAEPRASPAGRRSRGSCGSQTRVFVSVVCASLLALRGPLATETTYPVWGFPRALHPVAGLDAAAALQYRKRPDPGSVNLGPGDFHRRGGSRSGASGIVGGLPRVRGRTPGLPPAGATSSVSLPRRARLPEARHRGSDNRGSVNLMPVGMAVGGDGSTVVQGRVEHRRGQLHGGDRQHS